MIGSITYFTGPMACGKTLELVRHLQIYAEQRVPTICLRPSIDSRSEDIRSRSGLSYSGVTVAPDDVETIRKHIADHHVIGIDESQFFSPLIIPALIEGFRNGKIILISGLDSDFRGTLFETSAQLLAIPETNIQRSKAVCAVCRQHNATRTQRLINGNPAPIDSPAIAVEGSDEEITYEPRCVEHHQIG